MSEPDRKRRKYQTEHNVNPGPGPPGYSGASHQNVSASNQVNEAEEWKSFHSCVENLNQYLITRCVCPWKLDDYQNILISSGTKCSDLENPSEVLLFCSSIQLLCEEIARQNSIVTRSDGVCKTLKRLRILLFHVNSVSDPTCRLQHFLCSPPDRLVTVSKFWYTLHHTLASFCALHMILQTECNLELDVMSKNQHSI